jgi:hypothetical protein
MVPFFVHWTRMYHAEIIKKPGCYDEEMLKEIWIFSSIDFAGFVVTCIVLGVYNRTRPGQNNITHQAAATGMKIRKRAKLGIFFFTVIAAIELYWSCSDYNYLRPLLKQPAPNWTFGQVIPLATIILGILSSFWISFKIAGSLTSSPLCCYRTNTNWQIGSERGSLLILTKMPNTTVAKQGFTENGFL